LAVSALRAAAGDELHTLTRGEFLAHQGDAASATWVIERGSIDVGSPRIRTRHKGEIVGEAGLLHPGESRGADLIAAETTQVWCINRDKVLALASDEQAALYEMLASGLLEKLRQAVVQRHEQMSDIDAREKLLRSFVPTTGLKLIRARIFNDSAATKIHREASAIIWFSDIAGFSALSKPMSPEHAGNAAIALQTPIIRAIAAAGGELDKLMGDGAMGFWLATGDQLSSADAAAAVEAAITAARAVKALANERGWTGVGVRIGMHCGKVLVGDFGAEGRRSYTSIGPVVNTAARYEQARETDVGEPLGPVRISPELWTILPNAQRARFETRLHRFKEKFPPMLKVHRLNNKLIGELE
jgi:class 3 adenylate cyclase